MLLCAQSFTPTFVSIFAEKRVDFNVILQTGMRNFDDCVDAVGILEQGQAFFLQPGELLMIHWFL
jgi:CO dehydrogenase/acetyl-CoA synthase beta subunit